MPQPDGLSLTELEFCEARNLGRPTLSFIMAPGHLLTEPDVERDADLFISRRHSRWPRYAATSTPDVR